MKISQIAGLGLLTLTGAIALPAGAATAPAATHPPRPAANRTVPPKPANNGFKGEFTDIVVTAKAPNKPAGNSQTNVQSGAPGNGAPGNGKVKKPPGPGAFTDPNPSQRPEDNRIVGSAGNGQATTPSGSSTNAKTTPPGGPQSNGYSFGTTQTGSVVSPRDPASGLPTGKTGK